MPKSTKKMKAISRAKLKANAKDKLTDVPWTEYARQLMTDLQVSDPTLLARLVDFESVLHDVCKKYVGLNRMQDRLHELESNPISRSDVNSIVRIGKAKYETASALKNAAANVTDCLAKLYPLDEQKTDYQVTH